MSRNGNRPGGGAADSVSIDNAAEFTRQPGNRQATPTDALSLAVDAGPCESDRTFFRQHTKRNFRLRPAWTCEIDDFFRRGGISPRQLPDGFCWWIIVHQLVRHKVRLRWPLAAPHSFFPDPPEDVVRDVWHDHVPHEWKKRSRDFRRDTLRILKQCGEVA